MASNRRDLARLRTNVDHAQVPSFVPLIRLEAIRASAVVVEDEEEEEGTPGEEVQKEVLSAIDYRPSF